MRQLDTRYAFTKIFSSQASDKNYNKRKKTTPKDKINNLRATPQPQLIEESALSSTAH